MQVFDQFGSVRAMSMLALQTPGVAQVSSSIDQVFPAPHSQSSRSTVSSVPRHANSPAVQLPQKVGLHIASDVHGSTVRQAVPSSLHS